MSKHITAQYKVLRVFIASPGDLSDERRFFRGIIEEVNKIKAHSIGVHLEPVGWEDTLPGKGRPQSLINRDIEHCDLFVLLLSKRWGTRTGRFSSGTEEEFELARHLNETSNGKPYLLLYFKNVPADMMADPGEQLKQVIAFRTRIEQERSFFYSHFDTSEEWGQKFTQHLSRWLDDQPPLDHPRRSVDFPPELESRIRLLEQKLEKFSDEDASSQLKVEQVAIALGLKAMNAAREGRFTEAQAHFLASISTYENPDTVYAYVLFMEDLNRGDLVEEEFRKRKEQAEPKDLAIASANLGCFYAKHGELDKAVVHFNRAQAILSSKSPVQYYSVFISYASADQMFAERLHADLEAHGISCWFAPEDLRIGDRIRPSIDNAIRVHDKLLLILSKYSTTSQWVELEVESTLEKERREQRTTLFPIRLDDEVMKSTTGWTSYLRNTRNIGDFKNWKDSDAYKKALDRLIRDLKSE